MIGYEVVIKNHLHYLYRFFQELITTSSYYSQIPRYLFMRHRRTVYIPHATIFDFFRLEEALRSKDPGVTLPYWDCTLDYEMNDPTESVIFSYRFAGNGDGEVRNGKFRRWGLVRNLGLTGNLMNKRTMKRILKRRRTSEISEPTARNRHNMEFYHNGIHSWVGGDLGFLNTATRDPIFFLLHAFIDYIWWRFQQRQLQLDIDPFTDYPENFGHFRHAPDARMAGFENYVNADGYSSHWTTDIYTYQLSPECPHCGHSNWLDCVSGLCVSKTGNNRPGQRTTLARETGGRVFKSQGQGGTLARESDGRTFNTTRVLERLVHKEAAHPNSIDKEVKDLQNVIRLPARAEDVGVGKSPVQNTFEINGRSSSEQWVFMPVKVINERSGDLIYNSYPVRNGRPIWRDDIYTASNSKELSSFLPHQSAATYEHCKRSRTGVLKIYLRVDGLNYDGHSFEHALTDERLPFSSGYSYVAIKKPGPNATEIMVTAHDECGRMCKPMCRFEGSTDYVSCTGHLRVGADAYDMYAPSVAEAMNLLWKFKHDKNICPSLTDTHVYITFLCDSQSFP